VVNANVPVATRGPETRWVRQPTHPKGYSGARLDGTHLVRFKPVNKHFALLFMCHFESVIEHA